MVANNLITMFEKWNTE